MDRESESQALSWLVRIQEILSTPIFSRKERRNIFVRTALIEPANLLRDLMHESKKFGLRSAFTEDVNLFAGVFHISSRSRWLTPPRNFQLPLLGHDTSLLSRYLC